MYYSCGVAGGRSDTHVCAAPGGMGVLIISCGVAGGRGDTHVCAAPGGHGGTIAAV